MPFIRHPPTTDSAAKLLSSGTSRRGEGQIHAVVDDQVCESVLQTNGLVGVDVVVVLHRAWPPWPSSKLLVLSVLLISLA